MEINKKSLKTITPKELAFELEISLERAKNMIIESDIPLIKKRPYTVLRDSITDYVHDKYGLSKVK